MLAPQAFLLDFEGGFQPHALAWNACSHKPSMTPETKAREKIDDKLTQAGWVVQSMKALKLGATTGVAVREFRSDSGPADYLLFVKRVRSFKEMALQARSWRAPAGDGLAHQFHHLVAL